MSEYLRVFNSNEIEVGQHIISLSPDGKFVRTLIAPNQDPVSLLQRFIPSMDDFAGSEKIICLGAKAVSVLQGRYRRKDEINPGRFANFAFRFGTRTEHGTGVAGYPEKLQAAVDEVGMVRIALAAGVSALEKISLKYGLINHKIGLFFIVAGKRVEAIDGLVEDGGYHNHVILCPEDYDVLPEQLRTKTGLPNAIVDINYIGGSVLSISKDSPYKKKEILSALSDNPFGQDKRRTPIAVIGRV